MKKGIFIQMTESFGSRVKNRLDNKIMTYKAKYLTANAAAGSIAAVRQLDDLLVQLGNNYKQNIQISR